MEKEIIFKVGVDSSSGEKSVEQMQKELDKAKNSSDKFISNLDELKKKVDSGGLSIRETNKVIKEYQSIALQAGSSSPVGKHAIEQASQLKDDLRGLSEEVSRMKDGAAGAQAALQLASGIVAGWGAFQGVMALTGNESEELNKTMLNMQTVMSALMSLEQIRAVLEKESFLMLKARIIATKAQVVMEGIYATAIGTTTGAMKALRIAMFALPFVAIIAGITALVYWITTLVGNSEDLEAANDKLTESYDRQTDALNRSIANRKRASENTLELMKAQGASAKEIHDQEMQMLKDSESERKALLNNEKKNIEEKRSLYKKALADEDFERAKSFRGELDQSKKKYIDLKDLDGQYRHEKTIAEIEFQNKEKEDSEKATKEANDRAKQANEKRRAQTKEQNKLISDEQKMYDDLVIANISNQNEREIAELAIKQQRELDNVKATYGEKSRLVAELEKQQGTEMIALLDKQNEEYDKKQTEIKNAQTVKDQEAIELARLDKVSQLEADLINMRDDFDAEMAVKMELAELERQWALDNDKLTAGEREKIEAEYQQKVDDMQQEAADREQMRRDKNRDMAFRAFAALNQLVQASAKDNEASQRRAFQINKAYNLATAITNTALAVTAALTAGGNPLKLAKGVQFVEAGIAATAGIAQIAAISRTQFQSSGVAPEIPRISVEPPNTTPPTETTITPTTGGTLTSGISANTASTVVLVDSDIKAMGEKVAKVQALSTFP